MPLIEKLPFKGLRKEWIQRNVYFLIWTILVMVQFVRLAAVGYVNRAPIDIPSAFLATSARESFWLLAYPLLVRRLPAMAKDWLANIVGYAVPLGLLALGSLFWAVVSDVLLLPNAPAFLDHLPNRLLYGISPHLALSAIFMAAVVWRTWSPARQPGLALPEKTLTVRRGDTRLMLSTRDIQSIIAQDYYAEIRSKRGTYMIRQSIKSLQQELGEHGFTRVNRSTIINQGHVETIRRKSGEAPVVLMKDGSTFKVSKTYVADMKLTAS